jgi:hypothetical protein
MSGVSEKPAPKADTTKDTTFTQDLGLLEAQFSSVKPEVLKKTGKNLQVSASLYDMIEMTAMLVLGVHIPSAYITSAGIRNYIMKLDICEEGIEGKTLKVSIISGSHSDDCENGCLLGCSTVYTGMSLPTFRRSVLPPSSGRSETSVNSYQSTRRYNPEDGRFHTESC